jgi:hypothetical protein
MTRLGFFMSRLFGGSAGGHRSSSPALSGGPRSIYDALFEQPGFDAIESPTGNRPKEIVQTENPRLVSKNANNINASQARSRPASAKPKTSPQAKSRASADLQTRLSRLDAGLLTRLGSTLKKANTPNLSPKQKATICKIVDTLVPGDQDCLDARLSLSIHLIETELIQRAAKTAATELKKGALSRLA